MGRVAAVIVAAGTGRRMNSQTKKQYMEINGKPVLYYTLKAFEESRTDKVVVVTGTEETEFVRTEIVERFGFEKVRAVVAGGKERFDSVYAGIQYLHGTTPVEQDGGCDKKTFDYILVHDGVRLLCSPELINRIIDNTAVTGACVAAVPVKDTIKIADGSGNIISTCDRSSLRQIQTPQGFEFELLERAYEAMYADLHAGRDSVTDDSMLVEKYTSHSVVCVMGEYSNIKLTTPEDVVIASALLNARINKS